MGDLTLEEAKAALVRLTAECNYWRDEAETRRGFSFREGEAEERFRVVEYLKAHSLHDVAQRIADGEHGDST